MTQYKRYLIYLLFLSLYLNPLTLLALSKHSEVNVVKSKQEGQTLYINFQVTPHEGLVINHVDNAPWMLKITEQTHAHVNPTQLDHKQLNLSIPGFSVKVQPSSQQPWSFKYKLVAFVCTKDKQKCFRDVHKGTVTAQQLLSHP